MLAAADVHVAAARATRRRAPTRPSLLAAALAVRAPRLGHVLRRPRDDPRHRDGRRRRAGRPRRAAVARRPRPGVDASPRARSSRSARTRRRAAAPPRRHHALPRPLLARGARSRRRPAALAGGARDRRRRRACSPTGSTGCSRARTTAASGSPPRPAVAAPPRRRRRRPGHGQDDDRRADPRAAARAGRGDGRRRWSRSPRRPARPPRGSRRPCTRRPRARRRAPTVRERAAGTRGVDAAPPARLARRTATAASATTARNRLPHDVVIVDETSMVSLSLMARLLEAVRPDARLVLVGDPGSSTRSRPARCSATSSARPPTRCGCSEPARARRCATVAGDDGRRHRAAGRRQRRRRHRRPRPRPPLRRRDRRRWPRRSARGDADATLAAPGAPAGRRPLDRRRRRRPRPPEALAPCASARSHAGRAVDRGRAGRRRATPRSTALGAFRLLCAHRRGPYGVATWTARIESWLAGELDRFAAEGRWYVGRPLLVTENDYGLRLYNGDTGVVVATGDGRVARGVRAPRRGASSQPRPGSTPSTPSTR